MNELRIKCQHPESLKILFKDAVENELRSRSVADATSLLDGIRRTEERLREFESKYQLSTEEFLRRYQNDEFEETLELDEWIGESWMLKSLREKVEELKGVEFVN